MVFNVKKTEEQWNARANQRLETRQVLLNYIENEFMQLLTQFDGKVFNVRFKNAIPHILACNSSLNGKRLVVYFSDRYSDATKKEIRFELMNQDYNYTDTETFYFSLVTINGRISKQASLEDEATQTWKKNFLQETEEIKMSLKNYELYLSVAKNLYNKIQEFEKLPYSFRSEVVSFAGSIY